MNKIAVILITLFYLISPVADAKEVHLKARKFIPAEMATDAAKVEKIDQMRRGVKRIHGLIQLHHIPDKKEKMMIEKSGIILLDYIPENSWLVSISGDGLVAKESMSSIRWIGPIEPEDKIAPGLRERWEDLWARSPDEQILLRITYFRDVALEEMKMTMEKLGVAILREEPDFHYIEVAVNGGNFMTIALEDIVQWIEAIPPPPVPHNDGSRSNTGATIVQNEPYNLSGAGVDVGLWDIGDVDDTHDDFGVPGRVTKVDNVGIRSNHPTHVAGTLGGDGTRSAASGGTSNQWRGIAPGVHIFSYDFLKSPASAHNGAITNYDIEISNNSWGSSITPSNCSDYGNYAYDASSYDKIVTGFHGKRVNIIFSAGNERKDNDCPNLGPGPPYPYYANIPPPATAKNVITVGAINSDNNSATDYSGWGPVDDGRIKPELVAPGDEVGGDGGIKSTIRTDTYSVLSGTSMAVPAVSGAAALIIEDYRSLHDGVDPLPSTVKALLVQGAQDLGNTGPDFSYGYGKIDVKNAIDILRSGSVTEGEVGHQASNFLYFDVQEGTESIKATLVWDDEAAASTAAITLVNDLDLIVRDPSGQRHYPWTLDPNPPNQSLPAVRTAEDHRNNIEQVEVNGIIAAGTWSVEVHGFAVPVRAPQKYSLVFTPSSSILGVSVLPKSSVFASSDIPKNIPSGGSGGTSQIQMPDDLIISGIHVYINVSKSGSICCNYTITLTSPQGTPVILYNGNSSSTFETWFDTQTPTVGSLNSFTGESTMGDWTLKVIDNFPGGTAILNTWSIEVMTRSWAIGTAVAGTTKTMTQANRFVVQNIGNIAETYTLQISDPGPWSAASAVDGNGEDTFVMSGIFSATTDTLIEEANFNTGSSDDVIPSSLPKSATSTDFAYSAVTGQNGVGVPAGDARSLWLQFKAPTESSVSGSQSIVVTVGAMPP